MVWGYVAIAAASLIGSAMSSRSQKKASSQASEAQSESTQAGIEENRRQFDLIQQLLSPYIQAGTGSLGAQQNLIGLGGPEAQRQAISGIEQSPQFTSMLQQGENAILQNASATGGLRGGNTQATLAQFRPQLLSQLIESQYNKLGGLTSIGQASAAGQAAAAQQQGMNIAELLGQQGAARAGGALATGQANAQMWGNVSQTIGNIAALKAIKAF